MVHWLAKAFGRAVVRRLAYLVVAACMLAMCGRAHASTCPSGSACDEGQAHAAADSWAGAGAKCQALVGPNYQLKNKQVTRFVNSSTAGYFRQTQECWANGNLQTTVNSDAEYYSGLCSGRPTEYGWAPNGAGFVCSEGCTYEFSLDAGSSTGSSYLPSGDTCSAGDFPPPKVDSDGDGVPDDEDAFPNDPNESKDSDGDGIGDNADIAPDDPTNGEDDGEGNESDNQASGGGDCNAPPSCSGDAIACNTNWQIWRLRCSSATVTGDPTQCGASYTCNGDSVQCAQVALLRVSACKGLNDGVPGDGEGDGQPDWTKGQEPARPDDDGDPDEHDVKRFGVGISPDMLDREEIFGGGACPAFPSFTIMGHPVDVSDVPYWCNLVAIMRAVVLIMAAYFSLQILMGRVV